MISKTLLSAALAALAFASCRKAKPIDIAIPQSENSMVISSTVVNEHTIMVSAGYTLKSTASAAKTDSSKALPEGMLIDSAIITISEAGQTPVQLWKQSSGLYSTGDIALKPGKEYILSVTDCKKGTVSTATTTYVANNSPVHLSTTQAGAESDSLLKVDIAIDETGNGDYYFVSYSTLAQLRQAAGMIKEDTARKNMASLVSFESKKILLLDTSSARQNKICGSFLAKAGKGDTLVVQVARVDNAYYKYLTAYKRTGYFINQLTGEPINLPSNVQPGYGYFALYQSKEFIFDVAAGSFINLQKEVDDFIKDWPNGHL